MSRTPAAPLICLVTDRRRLAPGTTDDEACRRVVEQVRAAALAGITFVQLRERDLTDGRLAALTARCVAAVAGTGCRVLVNDRPDVALAGGAHGVHLRADAYPASRVRDLAPRPFVVGRAVHGADDAVAAAREGDVDYLVFGTVFATASKASAPAGADALAEVVRRVAPLPVMGIGGMTVTTARRVAAAGAAGLAGIGLFLTIDPGVMARTVAEAQHVFDTSAVLP